MIFKFLKQLFCIHEYECEYTINPKLRYEYWYETCRKCDKDRKITKEII